MSNQNIIETEKEITITSWKHFEEVLAEINNFLQQIKRHNLGQVGSEISPPLFRGQSNSLWSLTTTLDRTIPNQAWQCSAYHRSIRSIEKDVASVINKTWDLEEWKEEGYLFHYLPKTYEFMTYLRHSAFPSPLLDWSKSPYIAAFFAFKDLTVINTSSAAVYIYISDLGRGKGNTGGEPYISPLGPNVRTHKRHFLQQCEYTICVRETENGLHYAKHEDVFQRNESDQDKLIKLILPNKLQCIFLDKLQTRNINDHSLFNNEESLMHTLAVKYFLKLKNNVNAKDYNCAI